MKGKMKAKPKSNPIVLANTQWMPPDWLMDEVRAERMIISLCSMAKPEKFEDDSDYIGDAECLAYMMPATLTAPIGGDYTEIYLYLSTRVMKRVKKKDVPDDIKVEEISDYRMSLLKELKRWIFQKRNGKIKNPVIEALVEAFSPDSKQLAFF